MKKFEIGNTVIVVKEYSVFKGFIGTVIETWGRWKEDDVRLKFDSKLYPGKYWFSNDELERYNYNE